jgi:hypothetical protein
VLMVHPGSMLHACQSPAPGRKTSRVWLTKIFDICILPCILST